MSIVTYLTCTLNADIKGSLIVAIIAAAVSLLSLIGTLVYNVYNSRSESNIGFVAKERLNTLHEFRRAFTSFFALTNVALIDDVKQHETRPIYSLKLTAAKSLIETTLKPFYAIEQSVLNETHKLYALCMEYYKTSNVELIQPITDSEKRLRELSSQYDWAYWEYIKEQRYGKYKNSGEDFDVIYEKIVNDIDKSLYKVEK